MIELSEYQDTKRLEELVDNMLHADVTNMMAIEQICRLSDRSLVILYREVVRQKALIPNCLAGNFVRTTTADDDAHIAAAYIIGGIEALAKRRRITLTIIENAPAQPDGDAGTPGGSGA